METKKLPYIFLHYITKHHFFTLSDSIYLLSCIPFFSFPSSSTSPAPSRVKMMPVCELTPTAVTSILPEPSITWVPWYTNRILVKVKLRDQWCLQSGRSKWSQIWNNILMNTVGKTQKPLTLNLEHIWRTISGKWIRWG